MSKSCIIIPTFNEVESLPKLIEALEYALKKEDFEVIIIDDNSPDKTGDIAEELNRRYRNIIVFRRPHKLGIGSAICDGFRIALSTSDCKYIITMDADLSHDPDDVPRLLSNAKNVDLVLGSRYAKGGRVIGWNLFRKILSYVANLFCRLLLRTSLHEHTSYFRVYSRKCAETVLRNVHSKKYEWAIASVLVAKDHNLKVKEIPVTFVDRIHGKSKLRISDIFEWASYVGKVFLKRLHAHLL